MRNRTMSMAESGFEPLPELRAWRERTVHVILWTILLASVIPLGFILLQVFQDYHDWVPLVGILIVYFFILVPLCVLRRIDYRVRAWGLLLVGYAMAVLGFVRGGLVGEGRLYLLALPPVAPTSGWRSSLRLPRDHYVRLDSNDYSVYPSAIGRRVEVIADLHRVKAFCEGRTVADHERIWGWHQTISDAEHVAAARALRRERVGVLRPVTEPDVQIRCLDDYDTALGLDTDGGVA